MVLLGLKLSEISCVFSQTLYSSGEDVFPLHMSFVCTLPPMFCVCGILSLYTLYRILKFLKFLASLLKSSAHPGGALSLHLNRADTEHFLPDKTAAIPEQTYEGKGKWLQKPFQIITHNKYWPTVGTSNFTGSYCFRSKENYWFADVYCLCPRSTWINHMQQKPQLYLEFIYLSFTWILFGHKIELFIYDHTIQAT